MSALGEKVAVIAGGTSGIGARMAESFVADGAKIAIVGRRQFSKRTSNGHNRKLDCGELKVRSRFWGDQERETPICVEAVRSAGKSV